MSKVCPFCHYVREFLRKANMGKTSWLRNKLVYGTFRDENHGTYRLMYLEKSAYR